MRRDRHAAALLWLCGGVAQAAVQCTVDAQGPAFGIYDPVNAADATANGAVTLECIRISGNPNATVVVSFDAGNSGNPQDRFMLGPGGQQLHYNLYDTMSGLVLGDSAWSIQIHSSPAPGSPPTIVTREFLAQAPALQSLLPGSYSDTITITVDY